MIRVTFADDSTKDFTAGVKVEPSGALTIVEFTSINLGPFGSAPGYLPVHSFAAGTWKRFDNIDEMPV